MSLDRKTPLKRTGIKRARQPAKRRVTAVPRCSKQRCSKRAEIEELCVSHAEEKADIAFGNWCKDRDGRRCQASGMFGLECWGAIQAAHIYRRAQYRSVRYDPKNVHALCQKHHIFVDTHTAHLEEWVLSQIGQPEFDELRMRALLRNTDRRGTIHSAIVFLAKEAGQ